MLYETDCLSVNTEDRVAYLTLQFAERANPTLGLAHLQAFDAALSRIFAEPGLEILVIQSQVPNGWSSGPDLQSLANLTSPTDAMTYARYGQNLCARLHQSPLVSLAYLNGPCLHAGFDLAMSCDYRLAVATMTSRIGVGHCLSGFGGLTRLRNLVSDAIVSEIRQGRLYGARLAKQLGVVDRVCAERRGKIELQLFVDQLLAAPNKRRPGWRSWFYQEEKGLMLEQREFTQRVVEQPIQWSSTSVPEAMNPIPPMPKPVGMIGNSPEIAEFACELALRGVPLRIVTDKTAGELRKAFFVVIDQERVTPQEAELAFSRIEFHSESENVFHLDWVIVDRPAADGDMFLERSMPVRSILTVPSRDLAWLTPYAARPGRVIGLDLQAHLQFQITPQEHSLPDHVASLWHWLIDIGASVHIQTPTPQLAELSVA